ncbi:MAG: P-loop NTPase fold protein [Methylococcaceae bacterium]
MQIKPNEIEIDEIDPFVNDLLDRQSEIKNLTPIILNVEGPLVLSLDSPWGTGKTTFVKFWRAYLQHEQIQSIYFNAWETDYAEDPLIVLVSELDKWVKENKKQPLINQWTATVKKILPGITKRAVIAGVKAATLGTLEVDKQIEGVAADLMGGFTNDLVVNFNKQSKATNEFKKIVETVLEDLGDTQRNLIIFIDELDRCRPTYAIELLERIKHLFDIKQLVFVLSTDMTQLGHSVRGVYGHQFDAKKYLQRFIDLDYSLKKSNNKNYIESQLKNIHFANRERPYIKENLINCCNLMAKRFELKLRDINLLLTRISLISCSIPATHYFDEPLLISLLILRDQNKALYERYVESPIVADQVIKFLGQELTEEERQDNAFCLITGYLIAPIYENHKNRYRYEELIQPYKIAAESTDLPTKRAGIRVLNVVENFTSFEADKNAIARIELLQQFTIDT